VTTANMQFGFTGGKGTTDTTFIDRQLLKKYIAKKKVLWMAFINLEKAFDQVPRKVVWKGVEILGADE